MFKYILKRLLQLIPAFFIITALVFFLSDAAPGDPVDALLASFDEVTPELEATIRAQYGLDKPAPVRYGIWLKNLLQGDMGVSSQTHQPVWSMIRDRIGPTLTLTGTALLISLLIAIPLGIMAAIKPYSIWDNISSFLAFLGSSLPGFFVALVFIFIFSIQLKWLPTMGMFDRDGTGLAKHLVLPVAVTVMRMMGTYIKQTRGSILDVMNEEYVKAARAKGISEFRVLTKHVLRNALIPIVSCIGLNIPFLVGGATVTEKIFGWPGMGTLLIQAINQRDYNVIMGITVLIALVVLFVNLLIDLVYAYLDPKIRFD